MQNEEIEDIVAVEGHPLAFGTLFLINILCYIAKLVFLPLLIVKIFIRFIRVNF
jgi:hypothetical protein